MTACLTQWSFQLARHTRLLINPSPRHQSEPQSESRFTATVWIPMTDCSALADEMNVGLSPLCGRGILRVCLCLREWKKCFCFCLESQPWTTLSHFFFSKVLDLLFVLLWSGYVSLADKSEALWNQTLFKLLGREMILDTLAVCILHGEKAFVVPTYCTRNSLHMLQPVNLLFVRQEAEKEIHSN